MADNLGYGEVGCYGGGILRGAPTPRIDALAQQGVRLLNFNVEAQCTPSRSALLTGRFAIRSGTYRVPRGEAVYGLTQWETTLAEMLNEGGYATGHFGKWHLGNQPGRFPTDQGFDEWYGIPNSTSVSPWTSSVGFDPAVMPTPHIMEGVRGKPSRNVEVYDLRTRRLIDTEVTRRAIDFIRRSAGARRPNAQAGSSHSQPRPRGSSERTALSSAGPNSRSMAIASPVAFIWTPRSRSASGNLSNGQRGTFTTT